MEIVIADFSLLIGFIGAITGIIGAITGGISLIWLIGKNKPKLRLKSAYFHHYGKADGILYSQDFIKIKIILRNLGHRSTTVDGLWITYGAVSQTPESFKEMTIPPSSSKKLTYEICFEKGELKKFSENGELKIGFDIIHTFGSIRRKAKISLGNEYYGFK